MAHSARRSRLVGSDRGKTLIECRYYTDVSARHTAARRCAVHRRRVVRGVATSVVAISCAATVAASDDARRGPSPIFPLGVAWSTDLGDGPNHEAAYEPTRAYVPLRDGTLVAVDIQSGDILWSVAQPMDHPPVVGDGLVIIARDRHVIGLRAGDALELWTVDTGSPVSAPLLWTNGWLVMGLADGDVVAVRGFDGNELWRRSLGGTLRVRPAIAGGRLYVPIEEGRIAVLELADGSSVWEQALGGSPRNLLPLDALFVGSTDNFFYRLSLDDGIVEWQWRTGGDVIGAPSVDADRVYFFSLDNFLWALDRKSGVQQWRHPLAGRPIAGPSWVGDLLVVAGLSPEFRVVDAASGRDEGRYQVDAELGAQPYAIPGLTASGTRMIVITGDGRVIGLAPGIGPALLTLAFPPAPLLPQPALLALADPLFHAGLVGLAPGIGPALLTLAFPPAPLLPQPALLALADTLVVDVPPSTWVPPVVTTISTTQAGGYSVQLGTFADPAGAATLVERLLDAGFDAYVVGPRDDEPMGLYDVRVGRALARLAAERLADRLARELQREAFVIELR